MSRTSYPAPARARLFVLVMILVWLSAACSGPDRSGTTAQIPPTATPIPSPMLPVAGVTSTATPAPTISPTMTPPAAPTPTTAPPAATATVPPLPTSTPSPIASPASQAIELPDVDAHYRIDIRELDVASGFVQASEVITIQEFRRTVPDHLYLQVVPAAYGFFTLERAAVDGAQVQPEVLNDGFTLAVNLPPDPVGPYEIALDFHLDVGTETTGWGVTARDDDILRLGNWFPIISTDHPYSATLDPSYTATAVFDVTLAVDPEVEFAHTGEVVDQQPLDDGRVRYAMHAEQVRDFALALSHDYVVDRGTSATGVAIELYTTDVAEEIREATIGWAVDAIGQMSALVGPYPYSTFRIADAGVTMPGGVEFPGLIYINPDYPALDRLIYHEVAHQWLYGIIGTRTLDDGWIDEGGAEFFERGLATGFGEVPVPPEDGYTYPLDASAAELSVESGRAWYYSIYEQGARFYYDLLHTMGADAFWKAMRDLYDTHRFGIATAWDVLLTFQRHSTTDLRPLYRDVFRYDWIDQLPEPGADASP